MAPTDIYRVRLLNDCPGINPAFDPKQPIGPDNRRFITVKAGTELRDANAWMLCRPDAYFGDIKAEPLDEFTRSKVRADQKRSARILRDRDERLAAEATANRKRRSR